MKALTLWQPWASLIAEGYKTIETRSWYTEYRGPLAIHAAKRKIRLGTPPFPELGINPLPFGKIIAVCRLVNCVSTKQIDYYLSIMDQLKYGDFSPGRFAWILEDIQKLDPPIDAKGKQGLWNWDKESICIQPKLF